MRNYKKTMCAATLMLALTACLESKNTAAQPESSSVPAVAQASGKVYRVVSEITYVPFILRDDKGQVSGFEFELLNAIAEKRGFQLKFEAHTWKGIFDTLTQNKADIVSAGVTINEERKQKYAFTTPYFKSTTAVMVLDKSPIRSFADLQKYQISVKNGTSSDEFAKQQGVPVDKIQYKETTWLMVKNVMSGHTEAAIEDIGPLKYYEQQYKDKGLRVVTDEKLPQFDYGFVVRQNDKELLDQLNKGLEEIKQDGTYDRLYKKYFG